MLANALRTLILQNGELVLNAFRETGDDATADEAANGANFRLRGVLKILFSDVVSEKTVRRFDESVLRDLAETRMPVNEELPTWRVVMVRESETSHKYLLFACNHMLFDGTAAMHFLQDLAAEIAKSDGAELSHLPCLYDEADFGSLTIDPCSGDARTDLYSGSVWFVATQLASHLLVPQTVKNLWRSYGPTGLPNFYSHPQLSVPLEDPVPLIRQSEFVMIRFSPAEVEQILVRCRKAKVTMTPFIAACMAKAIDNVFTPVVGPHSQEHALVISGRRFYPEQARQLRLTLMIGSHLEYTVSGSTTIDMACKFSRGLEEELKEKAAFRVAGLLRYANVWQWVRSVVHSRTKTTCEVSNLTRIDAATLENGWRIEDAIFSQAISTSYVELSVVSSRGGMNVTMTCDLRLGAMAPGAIAAIEAEFRDAILTH